jgi:hypothetical protein
VPLVLLAGAALAALPALLGAPAGAPLNQYAGAGASDMEPPTPTPTPSPAAPFSSQPRSLWGKIMQAIFGPPKPTPVPTPTPTPTPPGEPPFSTSPTSPGVGGY